MRKTYIAAVNELHVSILRPFVGNVEEFISNPERKCFVMLNEGELILTFLDEGIIFLVEPLYMAWGKTGDTIEIPFREILQRAFPISIAQQLFTHLLGSLSENDSAGTRGTLIRPPL